MDLVSPDKVQRYMQDLEQIRDRRFSNLTNDDTMSLEIVIADAINALEVFYILRRAFEEEATGGGESR